MTEVNPTAPGSASGSALLLHVGSGYFSPGVSALHTFAINLDEGTATPVQTIPAEPYPTFFTLSPDRRHLYVNVENERAGAVAYRREPGTGLLTPLATVASGELHGAYVGLLGDHLAQVNYHGHTLTLIRRRDDGDLDRVTDVLPLGDDAYPHSVVRHPGDDRVFVTSRTAGTIATARLDDATGTLRPEHALPVPDERGPRHLVLSADGRWLYCSEEGRSQVAVYRLDEDGPPVPEQVLPTVPDGWTGENKPADIALHPSGRTLYVSNRGHDSVAVFHVGGHLEPAGFVRAGTGARNLTVDPDGRILAVGNLRGDSVTWVALDPASGRVEGPTATIPVAMPSGILAAPAPTS